MYRKYMCYMLNSSVYFRYTFLRKKGVVLHSNGKCEKREEFFVLIFPSLHQRTVTVKKMLSYFLFGTIKISPFLFVTPTENK